MVKILSFYIFSLSVLICLGQDTLTQTHISCPIKLRQICKHINNTYIGLDYSSKLVLLDSNFSPIGYGPTIQYINLNDYQSPLQIVALDHDNKIIYLDQNLSINRIVTPPNSEFIHFVSVNRNLGLWIPLNGNLVLYDPNFNTILQEIPYPNISNIIKISSLKEELFITEINHSYIYKGGNAQSTLSSFTGAFLDKKQVFRYEKHTLLIQKNDQDYLFFINEEVQFIHSNNNTLLILDTKGNLSTSVVNR